MKKLRPVLTLMGVMIMMICLGTVTAGAASTVFTVNVSGTCCYDEAQKVVRLVNEERKKQGLTELAADKELTDAAMLRAAECSIVFDHTRPDGSSCFTVCTKMNGENIAAGNISSAAQVFELWMGSDGHRSNILNNSFGSIGVGVMKQGNNTYWVQCFSVRGAASVESRSSQTKVSTGVKVSVDNSTLYFVTDGKKLSASTGYDASSNTFSLSQGSSAVLGIYGSVGKKTFSMKVSDFSWTSSDTSAVRADSSGKVTAVGAGTAVITASNKSGAKLILNVMCRGDLSKAVISLSFESTTYDGSAKQPGVTVTLGGKTLTAGRDYTVAYRNNINAGTAEVTVSGKNAFSGTRTKTFAILPKQTSPQTAKQTTARTTRQTTEQTTVQTTVKTTSETVPKTAAETVSETVTETVTSAPETETVTDTVTESSTVPVTSETVSESISATAVTAAAAAALSEIAASPAASEEPAVSTAEEGGDSGTVFTATCILFGAGAAALIAAVIVKKKKDSSKAE